MAIPQAGHRIPETIIASAQLVLGAQRMQMERQSREVALQQRAQAQEEMYALREKTLKLKEEQLLLQQSREGRLEEGQTNRLRLQEKALELRETLQKAKTVKGPDAGAALRQRKLALQLIEEDAALRSDAPDDLRGFSDGQKLLSERNRLERSIQEYSIFNTPETQKLIAPTTEKIERINREILERAKFKRDRLLEAGEPATLDLMKQYLPDMQLPEEERSEAVAPVQTPIDTQDVSTFDRAVKGALGKDAEFAPDVSVQGFRSRLHELKGKDPSGGQSKIYKQNLYRTLREKNGLSREQAVETMRSWGLP